MTVRDGEIRKQLRLGEDSRWEFKRIEFTGNRPTSPPRNDLADEMTAFANAQGGILLCGVTDDGRIQGLSRRQMEALSRLLAEVSTDSIEPALRIDVHPRELDRRAFLLVKVPKGKFLHGRGGRSLIRVGAAKFPLTGEERMRLARRRGQTRYRRFDDQPVSGTGFETLSERLWEPLLSAAGPADPVQALRNLRLLTHDDAGVLRATVAGVLLCTKKPHEFLPNAVIMATRYRGKGRDSEQLDAREITGPLQSQIADAMRFVVGNMRVAARKAPARENIPQYGAGAVFEAVVNAVVHRDYSVSRRRIRLSMFADRLELDSPGELPNRMTVGSMAVSQSTRNEVIASVFGRIPVGDVPGSARRQFMMERRGDGVAIILSETEETAGASLEYRVVGDSNLVLTIPAARLEVTPADATIMVHVNGDPLPGADVLVLFPNKTWRRKTTDKAGEAEFSLYSTHLPMTIYVARAGYCGRVERSWIPRDGGLSVELTPFPGGGSAIFPERAGNLPGLRGRLDPIRDTRDRTYLYADNIAIDQGRQQPVSFRLGRPIRLTDAYGFELSVRILDIVGKSALLEYGRVEP